MALRHADRPRGLPSGKSSGNAIRVVTHKSPDAPRQKDQWCYPRFLGSDADRGQTGEEEGASEAADESFSATANQRIGNFIQPKVGRWDRSSTTQKAPG
jgi:hypothetical protein